MSGQSLGLIETVGLTVAVEAADAAIKSANVELVGYELTKGGGLVTVKLIGEVGAMNAAVSAGVAAAGRVGQVYAWKVIARTATGIDRLIASAQTCGTVAEPAQPVAPPEPTAEAMPAAAEAHDAAIPVVNLEPVTESVSCLDLEESLNEASAPVLEDRAPSDEKKTTRPRGKSTRR